MARAIRLVLLLECFQALAAQPAPAVFTSAALSGGGRVYVSGQVRKPGAEPRSFLRVIDGGAKRRRNLPVPASLAVRELSALVPLVDGGLLVVSQQTLEQGDGLQIHEVDPRTGRWARLAELPDCVAVAAIWAEAERLVFRCEAVEEDGAASHREIVVPLSRGRIRTPGTLAPEAGSAEEGCLRIRFTGLPFAWESLEVSCGGTTRVFRP